VWRGQHERRDERAEDTTGVTQRGLLLRVG
jgi:hypothetical protein